MGKVFNIDSPVMNFLGRVADLMWLNVLTLIFCIPVITAGASLTAMNYVLLKIVRKEEGYITKSFFKSFKQNFKQATVCWLIMLAVIGIIYVDYRVIGQTEGNFRTVMFIMVVAASLVAAFAGVYVFPVLSRYDNTVVNTFKNSFLLSIVNVPKTIAFIVILLVSTVLMLMNWIKWLPWIFLFGISVPHYVNMFFFSQVFEKIDGKEEVADVTTYEETDIQVEQ